MKHLSKSKKRFIVIGLDSATLKILEPLVKQGLLPTFNKIMHNGVYGVLESTIPSITPCAWESSVTGVNPGKHNIFDFFSYGNDYDVNILTSSDRASLAVWDFLGFAKKKTIVFNYPMGYPPKKMEGIFISGMNTPGINTDFTYPSFIKTELLKRIPSYKIDVFGDHLTNGRKDLYFQDILDLTLSHSEAIKYLLSSYPWDLALVFFTELDRVHHYFYHEKDKIIEYYKLLDDTLKELLMIYPKDYFLIYSDHGTESLQNDVFIEKYLEEWGLLVFKKNYTGKTSGIFTKFVLILRKIIYKLKLAQRILRILPGDIFSLLVKLSSTEKDNKDSVDWEKTKVYFPTPSSQGLRINLIGRENKGAVDKNDYEAARDHVIKRLLDMKDSRNGNKIIKRVYKREEIYNGAYIQNAQDLIIETYSQYHLQKGTEKGKIGLSSEGGVKKSAEHGREGVYIYYHDSMGRKKGGKKGKIQIVDIAPSILHILGLSIPKTMEGKVKKEIFTR